MTRASRDFGRQEKNIPAAAVFVDNSKANGRCSSKPAIQVFHQEYQQEKDEEHLYQEGRQLGTINFILMGKGKHMLFAG